MTCMALYEAVKGGLRARRKSFGTHNFQGRLEDGHEIWHLLFKDVE